MTLDPTEKEIKKMCDEITELCGVLVNYDNYTLILEEEPIFKGSAHECALIVSGMYLIANTK